MAAVRAHPRSGRGRQPIELAGLQRPVGQHEHVGVPGQLGDVRHDVVVDQPVRVVHREQAGPPRRLRLRVRRSRDRAGEWQQAAVPAVDQVVHQRVDGGLGLVGRVEVLRPVPPHVEVEARVAQRSPAAPAEVVHGLGAALGLRLVVGEVAGLVDRVRRAGRRRSRSAGPGRPRSRPPPAGPARAGPRRAPCAAEPRPRRPSSPRASHAVTRRAQAASNESVTRHHSGAIERRTPSARNTEVTRTRNPLHARNTARRAVKPGATRVLDNAAGPATTASSSREPRPAPPLLTES